LQRWSSKNWAGVGWTFRSDVSRDNRCKRRKNTWNGRLMVK
jgi:hypothetical protein